MLKEKFDEEIEKLKDQRDTLLDQMEELANKHGFAFDCDYGGRNRYVPKTAKCEHCEGTGKVMEEQHSLPYPKWGYPDEYKFRYGTPERVVEQERLRNVYLEECKLYEASKTGEEEVNCGECSGTGKEVGEYGQGWQHSYC